MNKLILKAAIKRLGDVKEKTEAEIKTLLAEDSKNFSGAEIEEIYKTVSEPEIKETPKSKEPVKQINLNDGLGLEEINYENFMPIKTTNDDGEEILKATPDFLKYKEVEKKLILNKQYKFDQLRAYGQFRKKSNGDSVLIGIQIISSDPINSPTLEARHIIGLDIRDNGLNAQIHNPSTPPSNSRFYLLKKP